MSYNTALSYLMPAYDFLNCGTMSADDLKSYLISLLVRKGASRAQARRHVLTFLDS